jgi:serine/threonine-protein kinase
MPLTPGTWLNHYEILAHIGSGGMGEVYRANDNKLKREVALKVLPEHFARDPERVARFRREAQLLAQLNHPNIALIYNFEEAGETRFLVMELALGDTLRERIRGSREQGIGNREQAGPLAHARGSDGRTGGPMPVEEALKIAKQIAEALEHAHEKPIIHRDLKPANIKVTPAGVVKVLDFGLAKAFATAGKPVDPADIPTGSQHDTLKGTILGTPAYMSPEQASGRETDKRADIWSFGCVLYELLTGKQAFQGETITEILASVLKSEPDWTALPEATPPNIRSLLRHCLQKEAKRRLRDAADVQIEIDETLTASATTVPAPATPPMVAPPLPLWRRALPFVLTGLAAAVITAGIAIWNRPAPAPAPRPVSRFAVSLPPEDRIQVGFASSVAISPNGSHVVYTGAGAGGQLYLRSLDSPEVKPIPGTQGGGSPFFSPDGQWLGFFASGKLMKVALSGGPALTLCDSCRGGGGTWGPDDTIVFAGSNSLFRVPAAGGTPTVLTTPDSAKGEISHDWPEFLPGGKTLLFTNATSNNWDNAQIAALNLESGEQRVLVQGGTYPRYAPTGPSAGLRTGHLVYYRGRHRDGSAVRSGPSGGHRSACAGPGRGHGQHNQCCCRGNRNGSSPIRFFPDRLAGLYRRSSDG